MKIPILHVLNIKGLVTQYGLPIDPSIKPQVGEGDVYYEEKYPSLLLLLLISITGVVIIVYGKKVKYRDKK